MHELEHGEQRFGAAAQAAEWDARYSERDGALAMPTRRRLPGGGATSSPTEPASVVVALAA
jgi:hypothetical protein